MKSIFLTTLVVLVGAFSEASIESTFYVDSLSIRGFVNVGEPNYLGEYSKKMMTFEACLKDVAQMNSINNLKIEIVAGGVTTTKISDDRGCLVWSEIVEFNPDFVSKNIFMTRELISSQLHSDMQKIVFAIEPQNNSFVFYRNPTMTAAPSALISYKLSRDVKTSDIAGDRYDFFVKINDDVNSSSQVSRKVEISALHLEFRGIEFDSKNAPTSTYNYQARLTMDLIRQHQFGFIKSDKIKAGKYLFNLVFLKDTGKQNKLLASDVVASVQWTASPRGQEGLIVAPIAAKFNSVSALSNRMKVLLTVKSLDTPALFGDQSFEGVTSVNDGNPNLEILLIPN